MTQETIARLRIGLNDIEPEIWRTVEMRVTGSLKMLHDMIQAAMGWQDYHLWHFEAGDGRYGVANPERPDRNLIIARNVKLCPLVDRGVRQLTYTYDMGGDWRIRLSSTRSYQSSPISDTLASSLANGAARPRTSAAFPVSSCSSTP